MRKIFPGYFRPTETEFEGIWDTAIIALDANVLLNLYRYSESARKALLGALRSVKERIYIPNQAAKEFLSNRLSVTAGQAEEYTKAIKTINDVVENLSNTKRHPFLPEADFPPFRTQATKVCALLDAQREKLLNRLTQDETLELLDSMFIDATGTGFTDEKLRLIETEGLLRYQNNIPPGYRDWKKDASGDLHKKFGDLILWKQVIARAKEVGRPLILVTDDQKTDWWLEQSGRTIAPRPELLEEFLHESKQVFWMYSVEKFLAELNKSSGIGFSKAVIDEVIEISEQVRQEAQVSDELADEEEEREKMAAEPRSRRVRRSPTVAFMRPLTISPLLESVIGPGPLPRTEIVSRLWIYIKEEKLQDIVNKRVINCNSKLRELFGRDQISMFEMAGLIGDHVV
jgi:PIN like domain/SWIB/MDM2 domain